MELEPRLHALRNWMKQEKLDGFVLPVTDEFQGEYSAAYARRVTWLTGFDGSAGTTVILHDKAALFVDGRYTLQAAREVNNAHFEVHNNGDVSPIEWIIAQLSAQQTIGFDAWLHTPAQIEKWSQACAKKTIPLKPITPNPIDSLWNDQPARPARPIAPLSIEYAGITHDDKRTQIATKLEASNADILLITQPDALCWLLNIRGEDVPYNPLPLCYGLLLATGHAVIFADLTQVDDTLRHHLGDNVQIVAISEMEGWLLALGAEEASVMLDVTTVPFYCYHALEQAGATIIKETSPLTRARAIKNDIEIAGIKRAHREDGLAMIAMLHWIDLLTPDDAVDELKIEARLERFRDNNTHYKGASFATIAGAGAHGAIVHYRANAQTNRTLKHGEVLLLDSGGQYPYGTTDITRTIVRGGMIDDETFKDAFTRVLKGHIALATVQFPKGTSGSQLDVLARHALWQAGLDYDHGTGHGVGCYLCVHEGPQRISKRGGDEPLCEGMILSNEPGYYPTDTWGIRTENLMLVTTRGKQNGREWLGFETLTLAPIDTRLLDLRLMTYEERAWLNTYHQRVFDIHASHLDANITQWLAERCKSI